VVLKRCSKIVDVIRVLIPQPLFNYSKELQSTVIIYLNFYSQRKQECLGQRMATYDYTYLL